MYGVYSQLSRRDIAPRPTSRSTAAISRQIRIIAILIILTILFLLNLYHSPQFVHRPFEASTPLDSIESLPRLQPDVQPSEEDRIIGRPDDMDVQELDIPLLVSEGSLRGLVDPTRQVNDSDDEYEDVPYQDSFESDDYDIIDTDSSSDEPSSYQHVFSDSLSSGKEAEAPVDWSRFAYTQYVTDRDYLCNSIMIFETLHRLDSRPDRVLLYPEEMLRDPASRESHDDLSRLLIKARDEYDVKLIPIQVFHQHKNDCMNISFFQT